MKQINETPEVNKPGTRYVYSSPATIGGIHYYRRDEGVQPDLVPHLELTEREINEFGIISPWTFPFWLKVNGGESRLIEPSQRAYGLEGLHMAYLIPRAKELDALIIRQNDYEVTQRWIWDDPVALRTDISFYKLKPGSGVKPKVPNQKKLEIYNLGKMFEVDGNQIRFFGLDEEQPIVLRGIEQKLSFDVVENESTKEDFERQFPEARNFGSSWLLREIYFSKIKEIIEKSRPEGIIEKDYIVKLRGARISSGPEGSSFEYQVNSTIELF